MHHPLRTGKYFLPGLAIILTVLFVDQYTKWLVLDAVLRLQGPESSSFFDWLTTVKKIETLTNEHEHFKFMVITPFLNLVMVWNQGISFGLFKSDSPQVALAFVGLSLIISMGMVIWMVMSRSKLAAYALALIVGGALGNVLDRIRFDAVEDFIDVYWGAYHWPAFNVADSCIVLGALLLMIYSFTDKKDPRKK